MKAIDITGNKYGRWTALCLAGKRKKHRLWKCICTCGTEEVVLQLNLTRGLTLSCGCLRKDVLTGNKHGLTHGLTNKEMYWSWIGMRRRCYDPKKEEYKHYGGRGIKVCSRWNNSFENFYADMKKGWYKGATIERKNVDGDYEKSNCTWTTNKRQRYNCTNTIWVTYEGSRMCLADACVLAGVNYMTAYSRVRYGWISKGKDIFKVDK